MPRKINLIAKTPTTVTMDIVDYDMLRCKARRASQENIAVLEFQRQIVRQVEKIKQLELQIEWLNRTDF